MSWIVIVKFLKAYWKQIGVALLAALLLIGIASLYARAVVAEGQVEKLTALNEALEIRDQTWAGSLATCTAANQSWEQAYQDLVARSRVLAVERDQYKERFRQAQEAAQAAQAAQADLEAMVTSHEAGEAIRELVAAIGWGGES